MGTNITDLVRRAVVTTDKILKRARPADLPTEQQTKFELVAYETNEQAEAKKFGRRSSGRLRHPGELPRRRERSSRER